MSASESRSISNGRAPISTAYQDLASGSAERLDSERASLLRALTEIPGHVILVSNETGLGVVPTGELSRRFLDVAGELHQSLAASCDRVTLVVAGLPQRLKDVPP